MKMHFLRFTALDSGVEHRRFTCYIDPRNIISFGSTQEDLCKIGASSFIDCAVGRFMVEESVEDIVRLIESVEVDNK